MCRLRPGESCDFETEWFPTRAGSEFHGVTDAGILIRPLRATGLENGKIRLSGSFGVFFSGRLVAHFYDEHGRSLGTMPVEDVNPAEPVSLEKEIVSPGKPARLSLHLEDEHGSGPRFASGSARRQPGTITDMKRCGGAYILLLLAFCTGMAAQSLVTADTKVSAEDLLTTPVGANWTSYNGDYTGRRFSSLHEINVLKCRATARGVGFPPGQLAEA